MDPGGSTKASQIQALETMARALKALKQAKGMGVNVKPYRPRMKDCARAFQAGDYAGAVAIAERILEEVAALRPPPN